MSNSNEVTTTGTQLGTIDLNSYRGPRVGDAPQPTMSPAEAVRMIGARQLDLSKIYIAPKRRVLEGAIAPAFATNVVEGPPSIVELSRALQNDPDLIFQWVYNNVEYHPTFGEAKGALGCLVDGIGNSFDQSALLAALLTQAGFSPHLVLGQIQITVAQAAAWLGTDSTSLSYAFAALNNGGIPVAYANNNTELLISHMWVGGVVISGTSYVFDPSFKQYTTTTPINLASAMQYTQSAFLTQAETGATIDPSGNFVSSLNRANLRSQLSTYAKNLQTWIKTNNPTARLSDIVGGRAINQISAPVRLTALPYEAPGDVPVTFTTVPNNYRIVVEFKYVPQSGTGFDVSFFGSDVHGQRLTLFYDNVAGQYVLRLNGTQTATAPNSFNGSVTVTVTHPYATTAYNETSSMPVTGPFGSPYNQTFSYAFGCAFGQTGPGIVDYYNDQALAAQASGQTQLSEPLLGNQLALMFYTRNSELARTENLVCNFTSSITNCHHEIGSASWTTGDSSTNGAAGFNIPLVVQTIEGLNAQATPNACVPALGVHASAAEDLVIQQVNGNPAFSTTRVLDTANSAGTKIYKITPANQGTLLPLLSGFSNAAKASYTANLASGNTILIPQSAPQSASFSATGWGLNAGGGIGGIIADVTLAFGGNNDTLVTPKWNVKPRLKDKCDCAGHDPVNDRTGDYLYESSDISVGSQGFPYQLEFKSMYDSRLRLANLAGMGLGWKHNFYATAIFTSDFFRATGSQSPIEAAISIASLFVSGDLGSDLAYPVVKQALMFLTADWWVDQLVKNAVVVSLPEGDYTYILLPDGTYGAELNDSATLVSNGSLIHTTKEQEVRTFSDYVANVNQLLSWNFPNGASLSYTYNGPLNSLSSVANNTGRTLTLNYTGNFLSSVTDGNSRTVTYAVNTSTNLLTSISDPLANVTTFGYDSSNRLYQYFKPQNPTNAVVTNTYDSLNRISSQKDIYGNQSTYYFAGSRSAFVDPAGNTQVQYYDSQGNLIQEVDELGNVTSYVRDGRGRVTLLTYPERNSEAYIYDTKDNVLSVTYKAKPGSPLANIVNSFTYDPTYNKVHTAVDGKLQTTTYKYDPSTGNLLTVQKPLVNGVSPTATYVYNVRGQVISTIDETGIQTQNKYDTTTEELLTTVVNANWQATIGGTVTVGNVLTVTAHDTLLSGGQEAVTYTVKTGDTLTLIATGLAAAVNADANLAAVGIVAYLNAAVISLSTATGSTTFTDSVSGGATETIAVAAGLKLTTTFGYDSVGNVNSVKDALSNTTAFVFDKSRRLTTRTEATPFSYVTMYGYDKNNNMNSVQRQTGNVMTPQQTYTIAYTLSDKVYTVTDPATNVTTKTYDIFDRLWTVTDAQLKKTTFLYDQRSKLFTVTDPSNTISETRTYTNNGKLYQLSDARTKTTTYSYDGFDRANETLYADTSFEQNSSYDANNNVLTQLTRSGATITNTFDPLNRLSTKAPQGQATVTYLYDLSGRLLSATTPVVSGNPATGAFSFSYDTAGRLIQEKTPDSKTVKYGLDKNGNLTKLTYPDAYYATRVYDQLNRLITIELNGATTAAIGITYDELSRRAILTYGNGATSTYGFQLNDDLTSLAEAFIGSSVTLTYGFNKVHQETSRAATDGTYLWHPGTAGTTTYAPANGVNEYPTVGSASFQYDGNGNLKSDGTWTYVYDTENHLISATKTGVSASYVYDGIHRQIQKTVGSTSTRYYYAGLQRIADYSGTTLQNRYVYGVDLDEVLIEVNSSGTLTYLHADRLGSIVATTSSTGALVSESNYGPYGEGAPPSNISIGFTGQRYDAETSLYYYKRRYYSPALGRFLQPDPIKYLGSPYNLYEYLQNDPLNKTDTLGLCDANRLKDCLDNCINNLRNSLAELTSTLLAGSAALGPIQKAGGFGVTNTNVISYGSRALFPGSLPFNIPTPIPGNPNASASTIGGLVGRSLTLLLALGLLDIYVNLYSAYLQCADACTKKSCK